MDEGIQENPRKSKSIFLGFPWFVLVRLGLAWTDLAVGARIRLARTSTPKRGFAYQNRTAAPAEGVVSSPSHITRCPRKIVPTGHPVTVLPS
jgi:hypothetical protein